MKNYFLNIYLIILPLLFMPSGLLGAELRQVHVAWDYPNSVSGLAGYQLYIEGNKITGCTAGPTARAMDCEISLEEGQAYDFTLVALSDGSLLDSEPSASYSLTVSSPPSPENSAPTISGSPATSVTEGFFYSFTPLANDKDSGDTLTFSITNKPPWASFNTTSGRLSGTPGNANVGTTSGIVIKVTDSSGVSASLPVFNLTVVANATNIAPSCGSLKTTIGEVIQVSSVSGLNNAVGRINSEGGNKTVLIADGTYNLTEMLYITQGNVIIRSASGNRDSVVLRGKGMNGSVTHVLQAAASNITIADISLGEVANHAIQVKGEKFAHNLTVHNVHIFNTGEQMLKGSYVDGVSGSDNGLVECSLFEYTADFGPQYYIGGIDVHQGKNWIVRDNIFKNIRSPEGDVAEFAVHLWSDSENALIEKNQILNCDRGIGLGLGSRGHNIGLIRNNTIYANNEGLNNDVGIGLENASNVKVYNNTIYFEHDYQNAIEYRFSGTTGTKIYNNLTNKKITQRDGGSADLLSNVTGAQGNWFVNSTAGNLRIISPNNSVIDRGVTIAEVTDDIDGELRPYGAGYDIGADEYRGSQSANKAPIAGAYSLTVAEDTTTSGILSASDADGDPLTYFIVKNGSRGTATITNSATGTFRYEPSANVTGSDTFTFKVNDGSVDSNVAMVTIMISNSNDTPTISGMPGTSVAVGKAYNFTPTASDVDSGDTLRFSITNKPSWALFNTTSGRLSGAPAKDDVGTTTGIVIRVTDGGGASASLPAFNLTVTNDNTAPTISGIPATSVAEGSSYSFTPSASDVDSGDTLTFSIINKPSWASFNSTNGQLSGIPGNGDVGTTPDIVIRVTDSSGASVSLPPFNLTVTNENSAPTIRGIPGTTVAVGKAYSFTPTASDVDSGDTLTFSIINKPSWASFNTTSGRLSGTPENDDVGTTYGIVVKVTDSSGASASLPAFNLEVFSSVLLGDVNCDGIVDLADLHLAEEILSGRTPSSVICREADVNGDGVIGLEEHAYILNKVPPQRNSNVSEACTVDPLGTWIEAENYTSMDSGNRFWEVRHDSADGGVSNEAYMHTTIGGTGTSTDGSQTDYSGLMFPTTARYYFWIRAKNPQSGNSTWIGVDGKVVGALTQNSNTWVWDNSVQSRTGSNYVEITAGTHSLTMWPREQDQRTDGVLISTNPNVVADDSQNPSPPAGFKVIDPRQCP